MSISEARINLMMAQQEEILLTQSELKSTLESIHKQNLEILEKQDSSKRKY